MDEKNLKKVAIEIQDFNLLRSFIYSISMPYKDTKQVIDILNRAQFVNIVEIKDEKK